MVLPTRATSAVSSSRTAVAGATPVISIPPETPITTTSSDAGTESLILSEIRNLTREISALKSANQLKNLSLPSSVESLIQYGLRTLEQVQEEALSQEVDLPLLSSAISSWKDALANYELTNNLEASFDPQCHWDQESIRMARVMKVINDQQNSAYAMPQRRRPQKAKSAKSVCARCDRQGHAESQCYAKSKLDGSPC